MAGHLGYSTTFRDCRIFGHMWIPTTAKVFPKERSVEQSMKCKRCGAGKRFKLDRFGNQVRSSYKYDDAYRLPGESPHEVRADMRREYYGL